MNDRRGFLKQLGVGAAAIAAGIVGLKAKGAEEIVEPELFAIKNRDVEWVGGFDEAATGWDCVRETDSLKALSGDIFWPLKT